MAHYLLHTVPSRYWYVSQHLCPSLRKQGIPSTSIDIYEDTEYEGNLKACMKAFASLPEDGGTWHLQDDVLICKNFKELTEKYDSGIVCGFASYYDEHDDGIYISGKVSLTDMWFSFPCIRIPNKYARECSEWVCKYMIGNPVYEKFWKSGVNDDWMFRLFMRSNYPDEKAFNLKPNLVEHVDWLIGGQTRKGKVRDKPCRAIYWEDDKSLKELEVILHK